MLGVHLTILIGPTIPIPAPAEIAEAVLSVSVAETDEGRSGFQIVLEVGRAGPTDLRDYRLLGHPLLRPFNRVILVVVFDTSPTVLVDGFVTHHQFSPGTTPGQATLTLTGEDVSLMMDLEERRAQYPGHSDPLIVGRILAKYGRFGIRPVIVAPPSFHQPGPAGREPVQVGTDLGYLRDLARRHGLVFYVEPGPAPGLNEAYWGPAPRLGPPQRALAVNAGPDTNVESIDFAFDALAPTVVDDHVQDAQTHKSARVVADRSTRRADLAATPALSDLASVRRRLLDHDRAGLTAAAAAALAQAATNRSVDNVVTVEGALDAVRYGGMLRPRRTVVVRGAGYTNDGTYYVKRVSHAIAKGQYRQSFSLTREGSGASALAGIL